MNNQLVEIIDVNITSDYVELTASAIEEALMAEDLFETYEIPQIRFSFDRHNKSEMLGKVYEELNKGNPVILQVNGNSEGTCRHFVTVVGYKNTVTSAANLTEKDLLILDSWDGELERMDTDYSRFLTTGAQCGKEYSGYRLQVLKS